MKTKAVSQARDKGRRSRLVRTVYVARACSFALCFAVIGVLCWEREAGTATWVFLALTFLVYPHVAYLNARSAQSDIIQNCPNLIQETST